MTNKQATNGFTIVELIIVIIIIAILTAVTAVTYSRVTAKSNDSAVAADATNAARALEMAKVDLGRYPENNAEMPKFKFSKKAYDLKQNNVYYCVDKANQTYALGLRSKSGKGYIQTSTGLIEGVGISGAATCTTIGKTWVNDATTAVMQGYSGSTGLWSTGWSWTS
ncbi:hypothetical protein B7Y94_02170 [Candidatus Saccharibacteria bacterium 32-49-12]|nr:MAG: hypothetical protein B7Y94_02170 [Candidatus Saccharibacteria bacterium 32-49-12]